MKRSLTLAICGVLLLAASASAEWGDLTGRFVLKGGSPPPAPIDVTKDVAFCGKHNLVDESLVVGKDGAIANVLVYMYIKRGGKKPTVHPDYNKTANDRVALDNGKCRFEPRVVLLRTTQTLVLGNKDSVGHNSKIDTLFNPAINYTIPANAKLPHNFKLEERLPSKVSCSIHPWMNGWLLVKENPYMGVTGKTGKFTIKNIPAGKWTFQFWQELSGYVDEVVVKGKQTKWSRGRLEVTIKPGGTVDLGTVQVNPSVFD